MWDEEEDDRDELEIYAQQINELFPKYPKGLCTADVHKELGTSRQHLTLSALRLCGVDESWTILPTRYTKAQERPPLKEESLTAEEKRSLWSSGQLGAMYFAERLG